MRYTLGVGPWMMGGSVPTARGVATAWAGGPCVHPCSLLIPASPRLPPLLNCCPGLSLAVLIYIRWAGAGRLQMMGSAKHGICWYTPALRCPLPLSMPHVARLSSHDPSGLVALTLLVLHQPRTPAFAEGG